MRNVTVRLVTDKDSEKRTLAVYHNGEEVKIIRQVALILSDRLVAVALFFAIAAMFPN